MTDRLSSGSFFDQRNEKLRLPVGRDDASPCEDKFFQPVDAKAEPMFQMSIHIDYAAMRIFAKGVMIFFDDNSIFRILHRSDFP